MLSGSRGGAEQRDSRQLLFVDDSTRLLFVDDDACSLAVLLHLPCCPR